jgi:hypothetical protein
MDIYGWKEDSIFILKYQGERFQSKRSNLIRLGTLPNYSGMPCAVHCPLCWGIRCRTWLRVDYQNGIQGISFLTAHEPIKKSRFSLIILNKYTVFVYLTHISINVWGLGGS